MIRSFFSGLWLILCGLVGYAALVLLEFEEAVILAGLEANRKDQEAVTDWVFRF